MRKWLGAVLIAAVSVALWPMLQQAVAYTRSAVGLGGTSYYSTTTAAGGALVRCTVPSTIAIKGTAPVTGNFVQCENNTRSAITLTWSNYAGATRVAASGSATLAADGTAHCVSMTVDPVSGNGNSSITVQGVTASADNFYVELYFTASVQVKNGASGGSGGCP